MTATPTAAPTPQAAPHAADTRFQKGNLGGPGNPYARQCAAFRKAIHEALDESDFRALAADLKVMARSGNLAAIKLLLAYAIGKPTPAPNPDRVELEDWKQLQEEVQHTKEAVENAFHGIPVDTWTAPARIALDVNKTRMRATMLEQMGHPERAQDLRLVKLGRPDDPLADAPAGKKDGPMANGSKGKPTREKPIANGFSEPAAGNDGLLEAFRRMMAEEG
jgi:hypothetical protein